MRLEAIKEGSLGTHGGAMGAWTPFLFVVITFAWKRAHT
jgi:hypothetical protein